MKDLFWVYQFGKRLGASAIELLYRFTNTAPAWIWDALIIGIILSLL